MQRRYPQEWQYEKDLANPLLLAVKMDEKGPKPRNIPETRKSKKTDSLLKPPEETQPVDILSFRPLKLISDL